MSCDFFFVVVVYNDMMGGRGEYISREWVEDILREVGAYVERGLRLRSCCEILMG